MKRLVGIPRYKWFVIERFWQDEWGYVARFSTRKLAEEYLADHSGYILRIVER